MACDFLNQAQIPFAEIIKEGTLKELMQQLEPDKFESIIYLKHRLKKIEGNMAEGFVLKPLSDV